MRLWHVWYRRKGAEMWKHRQYKDATRALTVARFYEMIGLEVQLKPGSFE